MKKLALFIASCILAGTVHAVDVTKAEAATKIKSLPVTISTPGYYYLAPDIKQLFPAATVSAVTITASSVVLDLNGINIVAYNGIVIGSNTLLTYFVTVQNGAITSPTIGLSPSTTAGFAAISLTNCFGCTIDAVNINATNENGLIDFQGTGDVIKNCWMNSLSATTTSFGPGPVLTLKSSSDAVNANYISGIVASTFSNVYRNNTIDALVSFGPGDQYIGNAFLGGTHSGGTDIGGQ